MATEIVVWEIINGKLKPIKYDHLNENFDDTNLESKSLMIHKEYELILNFSFVNHDYF